MKFFLFNINIIYLILLIRTINPTPKISLSNRSKVRACMTLQEKKFGENENILNEFLYNKSYVYPERPNKIIILAMAYCYNKISDEVTNYINKVGLNMLNVNRSDINELYNFENYDYNDTKMNEKIYKKFLPVFNFVYKEMTNKESYQEFWNNYEFYFVHTKLFKFFVFYLCINIIIVYYLRIKNKDKYVDNSVTEEDDDEDNLNEENKDNKSVYKEKNKNINHRKLKKKKGLIKSKIN